MIEQVLIAQVVLWLVVLAVFFLSGQASLFHPVTIYLLFHGLVFVLRPVLVVLLGFDSVWKYMWFNPTPGEMAKSMAVSSVALVVFCVACVAAGRSRVGHYATQRTSFSQTEKNGLILTTLLLLPVILYSVHVVSSGQATGEMVGGTYIMTGSSGYINDAQVMGGALICAWLVLTRFSPPVVAMAMLYVMYRSYMGWARWTIVLFFLATALTYAWQRQRRWMPVWSVLLLIPVLLVFNSLGKNRLWFRNVLTGQPQPPALSETRPERERLTQEYDNLDFANFDFLTYIVAMVPERTGKFTYGVQHLQLFTEPIPRFLWKGKPVGAPVRTFNLNQYGNFLGLTVAMAGDGWMSGGWIGVVITSAIAGLLLGLAHRWFWTSAQSNNILSLFYILGLAMVAQHYRDGNVVSIAKFLFWNWLPILTWLVINWLLGPRLIPAETFLLPRGAKLRLLHAQNSSIPKPTNPAVAENT